MSSSPARAYTSFDQLRGEGINSVQCAQYIPLHFYMGQARAQQLAQSTNRRCVFMPGGPKVSYGCVSSVLPLPRARHGSPPLLSTVTLTLSAMVGPQGDRCAEARLQVGLFIMALQRVLFSLSSHWTRTHRQRYGPGSKGVGLVHEYMECIWAMAREGKVMQEHAKKQHTQYIHTGEFNPNSI